MDSSEASWTWALPAFAVGLPFLGWLVLRCGRPGDIVPRGAPPQTGRGLTSAALLYGSYFALMFAAVVVAMVADPDVGKDQRTLLLLDGGAKIAALLGTALTLRVLGWGRDPGPAPLRPSVLAGLAAGVAFMPLMIATSWLQESVWRAMRWEVVPQDIVAFATKGSDLDFALVLIFAVVLAPLFEETVFRAHLYPGLRRAAGPVVAGILSAALFSLSHLQPIAFPVTFLLGLGLAWLRERTGGRSAPIAMHACYNAVQMAGILALRAGGGPGTGG